jgi:hypothetical protein
MHSTEALHVEGKYAVDDDSHAPFREMSRNFVKISQPKRYSVTSIVPAMVFSDRLICIRSHSALEVKTHKVVFAAVRHRDKSTDEGAGYFAKKERSRCGGCPSPAQSSTNIGP